MFEGFKGKEGGAPSEGRDEVSVRAEDVEGGADVAAGEEGVEDAGGVVYGGSAGEDGAGGFEELLGGKGVSMKEEVLGGGGLEGGEGGTNVASDLLR